MKLRLPKDGHNILHYNKSTIVINSFLIWNDHFKQGGKSLINGYTLDKIQKTKYTQGHPTYIACKS